MIFKTKLFLNTEVIIHIFNLQNNAGDQFHFSQDSTVDELVSVTKYSKSTGTNLSSKNSLKFPNNSCEVFCPANLIGTIKKIKNNKRHSQVINRNIQKLPSGSKNSNSETKSIVTKLISTNVQSKSKQNSSTQKQIQITAKPKFSTSSKVLNKVKTIEQKILIKTTPKKLTVCAKRTMIKKQGSKKLKTIALSKIRHQFQMEFGESSLNNVTKLVSTSQDKKNKTNNVFIKKKQASTKL
jgi:hypothetical protein